MKNLIFPCSDFTTLFDTQGQVLPLKYIYGIPLGLRFDAKNGLLRIGSEETGIELTKRGANFSMQPIAFEIFRGLPFPKNYTEPENWVCLFGITSNGSIFRLLLRSASADEFIRYVYYLGINPTLCKVAFKLEKRHNEKAGAKYFVAIPEFVIQTDEEKAAADKILSLPQLRQVFDNHIMFLPEKNMMLQCNILGSPLETPAQLAERSLLESEEMLAQHFTKK